MISKRLIKYHEIILNINDIEAFNVIPKFTPHKITHVAGYNGLLIIPMGVEGEHPRAIGFDTAMSDYVHLGEISDEELFELNMSNGYQVGEKQILHARYMVEVYGRQG